MLGKFLFTFRNELMTKLFMWFIFIAFNITYCKVTNVLLNILCQNLEITQIVGIIKNAIKVALYLGKCYGKMKSFYIAEGSRVVES